MTQQPKNLWLHRISHHAEAAEPLLAKGFLTIGFSDFATEEFLESASKAGGRDELDRAFAEKWPGNPRSRSRLNLDRFLREMAVGDWVLVPSAGTFSLYEIAGEPQLFEALNVKNPSDSDERLDLGFFRQVTEVALKISRYDFADAALSSRLKVRSTNANLTDLAPNVHAALEAFAANRPMNLHAQIIEAARDQVLTLLQQQLNPNKLERLIKWYFEKVGATSVDIPARNASGKEGDGDVVATFEHLKTVYYIQAKHHTGETDAWAVQQIRDFRAQQDRMEDGYTRVAWVISTASSFSAECVQLAKAHGVGLFAGPELARMILQVGVGGLERAFL